MQLPCMRGSPACSQAVSQADALRPPLLNPIFSFWSPIPTRTRTITAQLQGGQILPFPPYQEQATLGAIKLSLANVAIYVALDAAIPSTAGQSGVCMHHTIPLWGLTDTGWLRLLVQCDLTLLASPCSACQEAAGVQGHALREHHLRLRLLRQPQPAHDGGGEGPSPIFPLIPVQPLAVAHAL